MMTKIEIEEEVRKEIRSAVDQIQLDILSGCKLHGSDKAAMTDIIMEAFINICEKLLASYQGPISTDASQGPTSVRRCYDGDGHYDEV